MALYHKHRPQQFADIVGQEHIVQTITNQIASDKVAHAYLFSGPRGVGKTTTARLLAKAVNCKKKKGSKFEPDNTDPNAIEISQSRSIDVIEIDAASHTGVDHVRENIIENAQFQPTTLPYKVFIIDEVHMLSTSAFNALLKTLEEPPSYAIFILATTEPHKLPETILSRCQRFTFKKIPYATMKKHIEAVAKAEGVTVESDVVDRIINKSDGCARDAISLLDQIMATGEKKLTAEVASLVLPTSNVEQTLAFVEALVNQDSAKGLEILDVLATDGTRFVPFTDDVVELLRILMVMQATGATAPGVDLSEAAQKQLELLKSAIEPNQLVSLIDLLLQRRREIQGSPIPQLPLEMAVIEYSSKPIVQSSEDETDDSDSESGGKPLAEVEKKEKKEVEKSEEKAAKTITEKVKKLVSKDPIASLDEVKDKWDLFISKIESQSPSLVFILKMAELSGVDGNTVKLNVQFGFHRDKLCDATCQNQIEAALTEVLGKKAHVQVSVSEEQKKEAPNAELQELATALGGEVVG